MGIYKKICKLFQNKSKNSKEIASINEEKAITKHQPSWMYKNE